MKNKNKLYEPNIKYLIVNKTILICPKSISTFTGTSLKHIVRVIQEKSIDTIKFTNGIVMLSLKGAYKLISYMSISPYKKRTAIKELINEDIINIMY